MTIRIETRHDDFVTVELDCLDDFDEFAADNREALCEEYGSVDQAEARLAERGVLNLGGGAAPLVSVHLRKAEPHPAPEGATLQRGSCKADCAELSRAFYAIYQNANIIGAVLKRNTVVSVPDNSPFNPRLGDFATACFGMSVHYDGLARHWRDDKDAY